VASDVTVFAPTEI